MALEQFINNAPTVTIMDGGGISAGATSMTVSSATGQPASGNFRAVIELEIVQVTAVVGTVWTIVRGTEGTTAASHAQGTNVDVVNTKKSMEQWWADGINRGTLAGRPAAVRSGVLQFYSDTEYVERDNGASYDSYLFGPRIIRPDDTGFSWVNQKTSAKQASIDTSFGGIYLLGPTDTADSMTMRVKTAPATPYSVIFHARLHFLANNFSSAGFVHRKSADGTFKCIGQDYESAGGGSTIFVAHGTSTGPSVTAIYVQSVVNRLYEWFRLRDDGTTQTFSVSVDGKFWFDLYSNARTVDSTPDQYGFYVNPRNAAGWPAANHVLSIEETA